ncbi:MAG TPA: GPW/gp25 family protein [Microlunatus sp.]|nr:GPW/gp25 family protein [Microlunatus sp.]
MDEVDFIGAGWSYPLGTDASGRVSLVTREREIEQSIRLILGTAIGERPMRPDFGCRIHDHVFGPANSATAGQIAFDVREALERWETRIDITHVNVSFDRISEGVLYVDIGYAIRGLNDPRNLVFPFYAIPDDRNSTLLALGPGQSSGQPAALPAGNGLGSLFYPPAAPGLSSTAYTGGR